MKADIHPEYQTVIFLDTSCDQKILSRSTLTSEETMEWEDGNSYPVIRVEISSASHPFYTGKKQLIMDRGGRIVNVSSGAGQFKNLSAHWPAYGVSKAALNALTKTLAAELKDAGIKVNAVCPGWVRTDMGGPGADLSVEEGADTIVWLATTAPARFTGRMFRARQQIDW